MAMDKEKQLTETKGSFEVHGKLFNLKSENAFKISDKGWRTVNLGVRISDDEVMFVVIKGGAKKTCWVSKQAEKRGDKPDTKEVDWADRKKGIGKGYKPIGVNLGLTKGEDGKNIVESLTEYDAYDYLKEHAVDGMSVFVGGKMEFSSYEKDGETKKSVNYVVTKMFLSGKEIDFQDEKFEKHAGFAQNVVLLGRHEDEGKFYFDCGVIGYGTFETASLECTKDILTQLKEKAGLKPYDTIVLTGDLKSAGQVEKVETESWGEKSDVGVRKTPAKTVALVTGARDLVKNAFTEKVINKYIDDCAEEKKAREEKKAGFDKQDDNADGEKAWGNKSKVSNTDDDGW